MGYTFFTAGVNQSAMVTVHVSSILLTATKHLDCILTNMHEIAAELSLDIGSVESSENFEESA